MNREQTRMRTRRQETVLIHVCRVFSGFLGMIMEGLLRLYKKIKKYLQKKPVSSVDNLLVNYIYIIPCAIDLDACVDE
jgi:ABC-type methionine transport system permease subunit